MRLLGATVLAVALFVGAGLGLHVLGDSFTTPAGAVAWSSTSGGAPPVPCKATASHKCPKAVPCPTWFQRRHLCGGTW